MIERRYNIRSTPTSKHGSIIKTFSKKQTTRVEKLPDSSGTCHLANDDNIDTQTVYSRDNSDRTSLVYSPPRRVTWTRSTRLGGPVDAVEELADDQNVVVGGVVEVGSDIVEEQRYNREPRYNSVIQSLPEEYFDMGLGRVEHRLSIVK